MRNKYRILEMLKDAPEDIKSMTVAQLVDKLTKEQEAELKEKVETNQKVLDMFSGTYIKVRDEDATFGLDVDYIRIDELILGSMNTDWEQLYNIKGEKVQFSTICNAIRELDGKCQTSISYNELMGAEVITKKDYKHAKMQLEAIDKIIEKVKS